MNVRTAIETITRTDYFDNSKITHQRKYERLINALNYKECKKILLNYFTIDALIRAYKDDKYLNNLVHQSHRKSKYDFINRTSDINWLWDDIGYEMLKNPMARIEIHLFTLSELTSIAKACARMVIKENGGNE